MKNKKTLILPALVVSAMTATAPAAFLLDFDNDGLAPANGQQAGGPHTQSGYQSYVAGHEVAGTFTQQSFNTTFLNTGAATVGLLPAWPSTTDIRVQQMIDRAAGNDANWTGTQLDLVTDWIGTDSRTGGGGNGDFDGVTGTPTYLTLTLSGLPANTYNWRSYHHDTENMNTNFTLELSTNGGTTFLPVASGRMTASTGTGTPAVTPTTGPDPQSLSSTQSFQIVANGTDNVVVRLTPLSNSGAGGGVHNTFVGINGFELEQVPEPSTAVMGLVGLAMLARRRRRKA